MDTVRRLDHSPCSVRYPSLNRAQVGLWPHCLMGWCQGFITLQLTHVTFLYSYTTL